MKKILSFLFMFVLLVPALCLAGCSNSDDTSSIRNNIYYVTKVLYKGEDISKDYTNQNMRIVFYENTFMVEFSQEKNTSEYGYYIGNFTIDDDTINLKITETGGTYNDYQNKPARKVSVLDSLRYSKGKLYTEFASNGAIYSFTFEQKN